MAEKVVALASTVQSGGPALSKFWTYARVEMRPPKMTDINPAITQAMNLLNALKSGRWKSITVKVMSTAFIPIFRMDSSMLS
ncbi:F-type H+-transporting ATPase subunit g [Paragonimus westermani]|uniref:F-type H+-transporting ATPase subunit g n=1 Tax=Paragonimus westermani TaxID=34504 RepID=A0A8T0D9W6_9TREM|nr:F-type H+-transporting ATPase subunit g [Paragonimus westermani]